MNWSSTKAFGQVSWFPRLEAPGQLCPIFCSGSTASGPSNTDRHRHALGWETENLQLETRLQLHRDSPGPLEHSEHLTPAEISALGNFSPNYWLHRKDLHNPHLPSPKFPGFLLYNWWHELRDHNPWATWTLPEAGNSRLSSFTGTKALMLHTNITTTISLNTFFCLQQIFFF